MLIKITVAKGVVVDVETSEPALVQIEDMDCNEISTFETVAQTVELEPCELDDPAAGTVQIREVSTLLALDISMSSAFYRCRLQKTAQYLVGIYSGSHKKYLTWF